MIVRRPRAPVFSFMASRAAARSASGVKTSST